MYKIVLIYTWICKADYNIYETAQVISCKDSIPTEEEINSQIEIKHTDGIKSTSVLPEGVSEDQYKWTRKMYFDPKRQCLTTSKYSEEDNEKEGNENEKEEDD
jgi:hypothetical protein